MGDKLGRLKKKEQKLQSKLNKVVTKQAVKEQVAKNKELKSQIKQARSSQKQTSSTPSAKPSSKDASTRVKNIVKSEGVSRKGARAIKRVSQGRGTEKQKQFVTRHAGTTSSLKSKGPITTNPNWGPGSKIDLSGIEKQRQQMSKAHNSAIRKSSKPTAKKENDEVLKTKKKGNQSKSDWDYLYEDMQKRLGRTPTNKEMADRVRKALSVEERIKAREQEHNKRKQSSIAKQAAAKKKVNNENLKRKAIQDHNAKTSYAYTPHAGTGYRQRKKGGKC